MDITLILHQSVPEIGDRVRLIAASEGWAVIDPATNIEEAALPDSSPIAVFATTQPLDAATLSRRALGSGARASLALVPERACDLVQQFEGIAFDRVLVADDLPTLGETLVGVVGELRDYRPPGSGGTGRTPWRIRRTGLFELDPVAGRAFGDGWTLSLDIDETRLLICLAEMAGDTVDAARLHRFGPDGCLPLTRASLLALDRRFRSVSARLLEDGVEDALVLAGGLPADGTAQPPDEGGFVNLSGGLSRRIGQRVKRCRRTAGLSRSELAARIGLSTQVIINLERGATKFDVERLTRVAAGLDLSVGDLLVDTLSADARRVIGGSNPQAAIFRRIHDMPDRQVASILRQLARTVH